MDILDRFRAMSHGRQRTLLWTVVALVVIALSIPVGLAVLGGGAIPTSGDASGGSLVQDSGRAPEGLSSDASGGVASPEAADKSGTAAGSPSTVTASDPAKLVRSAWLGIEVSNLVGSAAQVRAIASTAGGRVTSENVVTAASPDGGGKGLGDSPAGYVEVDQARLVLSIPTEKLDGVLTELSRLGTVSYRSSQTQDVTDTYVDTAARIKTMQAGVERVRALLARATTLDQIVSVEAELTRRQAELEALQARLAALDKQVAQSDVTVTLWTSGTTPPDQDDNDFVAALRGAWNAFLTSLTVILTGLAAMLPWLVLALLVVLVVRRFRRRPRPGAGTTTD